jgi:hypothetical protein
MTKKSWLKLDIILLILFPIFSAVFSVVINANYLTSILLFFGLPAIWLSYRTPQMITRTLLYAAIFTIPFGIIVDYIVTIDYGWYVPKTLFPLILGVVPVEDIIFVLLLVYAIIMFFEHLIHHGKHKILSNSMKYLILLITTIVILFSLILVTKPKFLELPYSYLWTGIIFIIIPFVIYILKFPRMISKFVIVGSYFFMTALIFELVALNLNQWTFPGNNFIGFISIFGYSFPIEELLFFMVFFSSGMLAWYEFYDDKKE